MSRRIDVTITYLEQTHKPVLPAPPQPRAKIAIMRAEDPSVEFYRYLYNLIGGRHFWVSRRRLSDGALAAIIKDPAVRLYVLYVGGVPAGLAEIDFRETETAELKFFGIAPAYQGRGLGRYFLTHAIDLAWSLGPRRLKLETCTLDHPAALPLYQKLGFTVFDQRKGAVELFDDEAQ